MTHDVERDRLRAGRSCLGFGVRRASRSRSVDAQPNVRSVRAMGAILRSGAFGAMLDLALTGDVLAMPERAESGR
jgi:hypothetical protein